MKVKIIDIKAFTNFCKFTFNSYVNTSRQLLMISASFLLLVVVFEFSQVESSLDTKSGKISDQQKLWFNQQRQIWKNKNKSRPASGTSVSVELSLAY